MAFLTLRDVRKSYETPRGLHLVLQGVDLDVEEGEFIAIVGYSGSGKTTLISLIALTRATLQDELARIWLERRKTVVMITNDVEEAILLADRIYPLTPGPGATLGPEIPVTISHPRSRRHLSLEPSYQEARRGITEFLLKARHSRGAVFTLSPSGRG